MRRRQEGLFPPPPFLQSGLVLTSTVCLLDGSLILAFVRRVSGWGARDVGRKIFY